VSLENYCRDLEAYLCRKNDGHLIRIAGPAFERVSRWAADGIPFKVACAGIDRYFERYYRRGPRRRPVRIEFCEADVLDAFDDWRRAVGVTQATDASEPVRPRVSLGAHLERTISRLTSLRASSERARAIDALLDRIVRELDTLQPQARTVRGPAREALLSALSTLDDELVGAAMNAVDPEVRTAAAEDALTQLAPFRERMAADAYERACVAARRRYVREYFNLPTLTFS
jgi:hypothetical protein